MARSDRPKANYSPTFEERTTAALDKLPRKCLAVKIPVVILADRNLTPLEKILFGIVLATDLNDDGSFWGNTSIEDLVGASQPTITKAYQKFQELGLADIQYTTVGGKTRRTIRSLLDWSLVRRDDIKNLYPIKNLYGIKKPLANISPKGDIKDKVKTPDGAAGAVPEQSRKPSMGQAAKQRAASRPTKFDPAIKRIVDDYAQAYAETHRGQEYPISKSRDYPAAKRALASLGEDRAKACGRWFLAAAAMKWERDNRGEGLSVALEQRTILKWNAKADGRSQAGGGFRGTRVQRYDNT